MNRINQIANRYLVRRLFDKLGLQSEIPIHRLNRDSNAALDWIAAEATRSALIIQQTMNYINQISNHLFVRRLFVELI